MAYSSRSPSPRRSRYSRSPSPARRGQRFSRSPSPARRGRRYSRSPSPRGRRTSRSYSPSLSRSPYSSRSRSRSYSSGTHRSYSSRSRSFSSRSPSPAPRRKRYADRGRSRSPSPRYRRRRSITPPPVKPTRLMVSQLTRNVNKGHIEEIFAVYGLLVDVNFPKHPRFKTNTGRAFVEYETVEDAEKAICHMDGGQLDGQIVTVGVAPPRVQRRPQYPPGRRSNGRYNSPPPFRRGDGHRGRDSYVSSGRRYGRSRSRSFSPPPRRGRGRRYSRSRSPVSRSPSGSRKRSYSRSSIRR